MNPLKTAAKKILRALNRDWEIYVMDYLYIRRLNRRPPELQWKSARPGPCARLDAGGARIGSRLYVFGGFDNFVRVIKFLDIYDFDADRWVARHDLPAGMAQSHLGVIGDGERFIYIVSGQYGNQCRPPIKSCFVYDTQTGVFQSLPPLPEARYAPTVQLWRGRLHAVGGSKEDRNTPSTDHWSIAVDNGRAVETAWRREPAVPRGGPHRGSAVAGDALYVFGGQEGDYIAIPGDPDFTCTGDLTNEVVYADTYRLGQGKKSWQRMADMPVKVSHVEFASLVMGPFVVVAGGMDNKDPRTKEVTVTDVIQMYDTRADTWRVAGHLPYCLKATIAAHYKGQFYVTTGQRNKDVGNMRADSFDLRVWRAAFSV